MTCLKRKGENLSTLIEIYASVDMMLADEENPCYMRTELTPRLSSTTRFDRVMYSHLGFHSHSDGQRRIKQRLPGRYTYIGLLEPNVDAHITISPFKLTLENLGDGFMGVHVRMRDGTERCKVTILQEEHQPKPPKDVDEFIKLDGSWHC